MINAPSRVGQITTSGTAVNNQTITVGAGGVPKGAVMVAYIATGDSVSLSSMSDSGSNSWTVQRTGTSTTQAHLATAVVTTALVNTNTITVTFSANADQVVIVDYWTGVDVGNAVQVVGTGTTTITTTATVTSPTISVNPYNVAIGCFCENFNDLLTAGAGYTLGGNLASTSVIRGLSYVWKVSGGASETPGGTWAQAGSGTGASMALSALLQSPEPGRMPLGA